MCVRVCVGVPFKSKINVSVHIVICPSEVTQIFGEIRREGEIKETENMFFRERRDCVCGGLCV